MIITTKRGEQVVYQQVLEDSKTLNATISHLMAQPSGTTLLTVVNNNGHDLPFATAEFPLVGLVRKVNGIITKGA